MAQAPACPVNEAVVEALRDAADVLDERGILVIPHLEATRPLPHGRVLHQAVYTIFRGLPERMPRGATLYVSTRDAPGPGVELAWESREDAALAPVEAPSARDVLGRGPHGDLLELAILGLETLCGVHARHAGSRESLARGLSGLDLAPRVQRRYVFVIPAGAEA